MSTLSPERARELMHKMRDAAAGTTGREMHVCVNSGELEDLLTHFDGLEGASRKAAPPGECAASASAA